MHIYIIYIYIYIYICSVVHPEAWDIFLLFVWIVGVHIFQTSKRKLLRTACWMVLSHMWQVSLVSCNMIWESCENMKKHHQREKTAEHVGQSVKTQICSIFFILSCCETRWVTLSQSWHRTTDIAVCRPKFTAIGNKPKNLGCQKWKLGHRNLAPY